MNRPCISLTDQGLRAVGSNPPRRGVIPAPFVVQCPTDQCGNERAAAAHAIRRPPTPAPAYLPSDMSYFQYCEGFRMTSRKFDALFDGPPRKPESPITEREMDIAASIQAVTEEAMLHAARHVHAETGLRNLCLAGGVALNCVANGRVLRESPFDNVWSQPAAGDAGGALGVALFVWYQLLEDLPEVRMPDAKHGALLGPQATKDDIRSSSTGPARSITSTQKIVRCARPWPMAQEEIVEWIQGPMEFGPSHAGLAEHSAMLAAAPCSR